jgi:hypothetical protein
MSAIVVASNNSCTGMSVLAFPPVLGYGLMYQPLAKQLSGYRICAFDFIEEDLFMMVRSFIPFSSP